MIWVKNNKTWYSEDEVALLKAENEKLNKLLEEEGKIVQTKTGTIFTLSEQNKVLRKENKKYKQALEEVGKYCNECNLKADYTACEILKIINEVLK